MRELLADLELHVRRDLASRVEKRVGEGSACVLGVISRTIDEHLGDDDDLVSFGLLAEVLGRASKGRYWKGWRGVVKAAREGRGL